MLGLATNLVAAGLLAFTIFFYAVIYTMLLKRWTPQNIVIGGAAGAFPPVIGWAAATGSVSIESVLMFALIFMWTPPHFWALALFMRSDYDDAGVPMLTVTHGRRSTRRHILAYTLLLAPVSLGLAFTSVGGPVSRQAAIVRAAADRPESDQSRILKASGGR
jgi:protoheme IX farnesyltransferase